MNDTKPEYSEEDIETTIKYLKTIDLDKATRDNAIKMLQGMQVSAHVIAHDLIDNKKVDE